MTISDIAKMAGVSSAAVSRYLNGGPLSEQKRAVIHEVVEKTGYRPDTAAQTLRTGKVNQVGVIAPSIGSQSVGQITAGIASELDAKSYLLLLGNTELDAQRELDCQIPLDLSAAKVGLIGFGAIGQAAAQRLRAYGSTLYYYARHRRDRETEEDFGVAYLPLYELAETCDIISLYLPATAESRHMLNGEFFSHVKPGTYLVNTARGAVIDDEALGEAIRSGRLAGAAVDAYDPEPVGADHPLVRLAEEFPDRLVLCPHQGGIARSAYQNVYRMLFENLERLMEGKRPERIVNGL